MTPQYILRKSLCRKAHCFSAHVPGKGYVNRGELAEEMPEYNRQRMRSAESEIENIQYASDYAEPGYDAPRKGILFANWNVFPSWIDDVLERAGYAIEWIDEWMVCECGKAFRTSPNSYSWTMQGAWIDECTLLCAECIRQDPAEYLESLEDETDKAVTIDDIDPGDYGYVRYNDDAYENGWHSGQNDNPRSIYKEMIDKGYDHILFTIDGVGQFDTIFTAWYKPREEDDNNSW